VDFRTLELRIAEFRQAGGDLSAALAQPLPTARSTPNSPHG
jgi:hypothetical protein